MYIRFRVSINTKIDDLESPLNDIQGHLFFKWRKNGEIQLSNHSDAMYSGWMHYVYYRPTTYVFMQWYT